MQWKLKVDQMMAYLKQADKMSDSVKQMMSKSGLATLSIQYDSLRVDQEVWCSVLNFLGVSCRCQ